MTPEEARDLLDGTTPAEDWWYSVKGGWVRHLEPVGIDAAGELDVSEDDAALIAAAPVLASMIAGMREEWGAERQVRGRWVRIVFALNTLWTDDRAIAESAVDDCRDLGLPARIVRRYVTELEEA